MFISFLLLLILSIVLAVSGGFRGLNGVHMGGKSSEKESVTTKGRTPTKTKFPRRSAMNLSSFKKDTDNNDDADMMNKDHKNDDDLNIDIGEMSLADAP